MAAPARLRLHRRGPAQLLLAHGGDRQGADRARWARTAPLAVLSDQAPSLFHYFHQLFAQVTNPPIDPHPRGAGDDASATATGPDGNTFEETPEQCHRLTLPGPILTNGQLARLADMPATRAMFELPRRLSALFERDAGEGALEAAVERLCQQAVEAVDEGASLLILSDRGRGRRARAHPGAARPLRGAPAAGARRHPHAHRPAGGDRPRRARCTTSRALFGFGAAAVNPVPGAGHGARAGGLGRAAGRRGARPRSQLRPRPWRRGCSR